MLHSSEQARASSATPDRHLDCGPGGERIGLGTERRPQRDLASAVCRTGVCHQVIRAGTLAERRTGLYHGGGIPGGAAKVKEIVRYDSATGQREVLVSAQQLTPSGEKKPLMLEDYSWSANLNR